VRFAAAAVFLAMALAGCGTPQRLALDIPRCDAVKTAHGITLKALVINRATKPISGLAVVVDFYHDFRSVSLRGTSTVKPALDPDKQVDVIFNIPTSASQAEGRPIRCLATHIDYSDGTSTDVTTLR